MLWRSQVKCGHLSKLAEQAAMKTENQCDLGWIKKNHQPEIRQSPFLSNLSGCHHVMSSTTYTPANQELEALVIEGSMFRTATWKGWSFGLCGSTSESMPCNLHHLHKSPNLRPPQLRWQRDLTQLPNHWPGTRERGDFGIDRRVMWRSSGHNNAQESTQWFWDSKTGCEPRTPSTSQKKVDEYIMLSIAFQPMGVMYIKPLKTNM